MGISTKSISAHMTQRNSQVCSSLVTVPPVVLLVPLPSPSSTHLISQEPDLPLMLVPEKKENSLDSLIALKRVPLKVLVVSTTVSESPSLVSSLTEPLTSVCSILVKLFCSKISKKLHSLLCGVSPKLSLLEPVLSPILSIPSEEDL